MIDLENTYIENDNGKLRDLYVAEAMRQGYARYSDTAQCKYLEVVSVSGRGVCIYSTSAVEMESKKITLADFKPLTRTEYVKLELKTKDFYMLMLNGDKLYNGDGSVTYKFDGKNFIGARGGDSDSDSWTIECRSEREPFYRKVEKEITWYEDAINYAKSCEGVNTAIYSKEYDSIDIDGSMTRQECNEYAKLLLENC